MLLSSFVEYDVLATNVEMARYIFWLALATPEILVHSFSDFSGVCGVVWYTENPHAPVRVVLLFPTCIVSNPILNNGAGQRTSPWHAHPFDYGFTKDLRTGAETKNVTQVTQAFEYTRPKLNIANATQGTQAFEYARPRMAHKVRDVKLKQVTSFDLHLRTGPEILHGIWTQVH